MKTLIAIMATLTLLLGAHSQADDNLSQAELNQMLAPVALYPDTVLSHLLIASTYPLEVVQAERWASQNTHREGDDAVNAVDHKNWDPSVKALVAFPDLLERMAEDLDWTQSLGEAFLYDEAAVLATVQDLRQRAYEAGNLRTTEHQEVVRQKQTIIIEPRVSEVIYIPYYDTRVVYGPWYWHNYQPVRWHHPSHGYWHAGVFWSHGTRISSHFYFSSFHWSNHHVVVVDIHSGHHRPRFHSGRSVVRYRDAKRWHHSPTHRRGVEYRRATVRKQYATPARQERSHRIHSGGGNRAQGLEHRMKERSRASTDNRRAHADHAAGRKQPSVNRQHGRDQDQHSRMERRTLPDRQERATRSDRANTDRTKADRTKTRTPERTTERRRSTVDIGSPKRRDARSDRIHQSRGTPQRQQRSPNNFGNQSLQRSNRQRMERSGGRTTSERGSNRRTTRDR
ncbi:DUF3300 domain-containing protein [Marinimicrobium sp. C2-29]|uniref:DUF3300 domain-containing protein n=1 Tax=Marinimicrobium sp. C2-29 TaxID=3139825 RepID=UPI00313870BD